MPTFWLGLMVILVFAEGLGLLPSGGMYTIGAPFSLADRFRHLIAPAMVLATPRLAEWVRFTHSSMVEVMQEDYIRTARAKGLAEIVIHNRHAFRNVLIVLVTLLGLSVPVLFSGALVTEGGILLARKWAPAGRLPHPARLPGSDGKLYDHRYPGGDSQPAHGPSLRISRSSRQVRLRGVCGIASHSRIASPPLLPGPARWRALGTPAPEQSPPAAVALESGSGSWPIASPSSAWPSFFACCCRPFSWPLSSNRTTPTSSTTTTPCNPRGLQPTGSAPTIWAETCSLAFLPEVAYR